MEYNINLGVWKSVFAVPSVIVDSHIKLAGAAQLKVILWVLRNSGENFTVDDIVQALNMQPADVRDCMQYWIQTGVIAINDGEIQPSQPIVEVNQNEVAVAVQEENTETKSETNKKHILSRPQKSDMKYISQRIGSDKNIAFLMQSADEIFGRMTSPNDKATLLLINEHYGLPIEVIIMLLQYVSEIGKCNMRYIEKMAIEWSEKEILTLALAEKQIEYLTNGRNAAKIVQHTIEQEEHSPTKDEIEIAERWINQWKFTTDMIREAYEICVNTIGKYKASYTNKVLERWYNEGISTLEQARAEKQNKKPKQKDSYKATYDIAEYESTSVIDEGW